MGNSCVSNENLVFVLMSQVFWQFQINLHILTVDGIKNQKNIVMRCAIVELYGRLIGADVNERLICDVHCHL
jgi:hypothetical protein